MDFRKGLDMRGEECVCTSDHWGREGGWVLYDEDSVGFQQAETQILRHNCQKESR